jgi:hypothetical protein
MMIEQYYIKEVLNFGISYFSSDGSDTEIEATFNHIEEFIAREPNSRKVNTGFSTIRDALAFVLSNSTITEMDEIVSEFNLRPETLGGGKAFLERCHKTINDALGRLYGVG